ncbi:universal stress protein [Halobacterium jilantaiense]|uniref:Nucleotide-binding universal stress protein, UspA family n=1 Tax=Halobacterium jilantaiense TaxID=355548 RepID=A0A1I0N7Z1_9EURY|nr:universal stress protein [Halobacterium jilantaiense]SEV97251.1 Nucleotide-binding universal stress protein, UspA family [Halobacterium jilantaiense]
MVRRVLVPVDGSELATRALEYALDVHGDDDITLLYVAGEASPMMGSAAKLALEDDLDEAILEEAEEVFGPARELADECGVSADAEIGLGKPASVIVEHAENHDVVVLGSHSSSLRERLLVGNVATKVVENAPVPVTVVR